MSRIEKALTKFKLTHQPAPVDSWQGNGTVDLAKGVPRLVAFHQPSSPSAENYRRVRAKLKLGFRKVDHCTVLITSALRGEGKTTTVLNLAITMAQDLEGSVVAVNGDFRHPSFAQMLGCPMKQGIVDVLLGEVGLEEVLRATSLKNLTVLPRGEITPTNPAELVGSRTMHQILNQLKQQFDFVLVDSPPVLAVADALLLSEQVDGVVLVIDSEKTRRQYAKELMEHLNKSTILGFILNRCQQGLPYHYHYYKKTAQDNHYGTTS